MLTLEELHRLHVRHLRALRRSDHTVKFYTAAVQKFAQWLRLEGHSDVSTLTRSEITAFQLWLREQGLSEGGEHAILRGVRATLRFGVDEELFSRDPFKKVKMPKLPADPPPAAQPHEVAAMLRAAREGPFPWRDRALLMVAYDTGLRCSELVALTCADVDLVNGIVHVRRGKGGKPRQIPIGVRSGQAVTAYERRERKPARPVIENLFLARGGVPLTTSGVSQAFLRLAEAAGLPRDHVAPHALRRGFSVQFLRGGGDVFALQQLLGHTTLEMSRRYARYLPADLQKQHMLASPGDHL